MAETPLGTLDDAVVVSTDGNTYEAVSSNYGSSITTSPTYVSLNLVTTSTRL